MDASATKRFVFIGGIPCFDYMIHLDWDEISKATDDHVFILDDKILLPVGTIFKFNVPELDQTIHINPMANVAVREVRGEPYYAMECGGKHPECQPYTLRGELETIFTELHEAFPEDIKSLEDLKVIEASNPVKIIMGGNNRNIIDAITTLFSSPELADLTRGVAMEHHFFIDNDNPKFKMVMEEYTRLGVALGDGERYHVPGLEPRVGFVFTIKDADAKTQDRIILSNRINEEVIPKGKINETYFKLEHDFRCDDRPQVDTCLIINSMTNPEEMRHIPRLLQTCYASGVTTYLCPTATTVRTVDTVVAQKFYTTEKQHFFQYRKDFFYTSVLPYIHYLILNRDELALVDDVMDKKGIDETASHIANKMNRGKHGDSANGGNVVVTGGSQGARYTERLSPKMAALYWEKAHLPANLRIHFAERRLVCGDDYLTSLVSTLGAGDAFTAAMIGLTALGWDGGHALRAATLGAQHYIMTREHPRLSDMMALDEEHIRMGTETEMVDVISHHVDQSGDATRYGTISETVVTIRTAQIHHPFREALEVAMKMAGSGRSRTTQPTQKAPRS